MTVLNNATSKNKIKALIKALLLKAQLGDAEATNALLSISQAAKQGDPKATAIYNMVAEVAKEMGAQVARLGAKLSYVRKLKGQCPEGQQLVYFKKGGRICKECVEAYAEGGDVLTKDTTKSNAVDDFKKKQAEKKNTAPVKKLDPNNTPKLPGGKYPTYWTPSLRAAWERKYGDYSDGAAATDPLWKKNNVKSRGCGGLVKVDKCGGKSNKKNK